MNEKTRKYSVYKILRKWKFGILVAKGVISEFLPYSSQFLDVLVHERVQRQGVLQHPKAPPLFSSAHPPHKESPLLQSLVLQQLRFVFCLPGLQIDQQQS